jgi:uncharacterized C2H2 Zn-finger protein
MRIGKYKTQFKARLSYILHINQAHKYPEPSWFYPVNDWIRGKELEKEMKKRNYKI